MVSPKREKNKSKLRMVNLCNVGSKGLWEIKHLKIRTHFSIRQTKLFWINLEHYSQTSSNDHLCKTTIRLRRPMLSPPKQIPVQLLLHKTTICLTRPTTTFFCLSNEKSLSKTTTKKLYPTKKYETNMRNNARKINVSLIIFTLLLLFNAKFV